MIHVFECSISYLIFIVDEQIWYLLYIGCTELTRVTTSGYNALPNK